MPGLRQRLRVNGKACSSVAIVEARSLSYHADMASIAASLSNVVGRNTRQRNEIRAVFERNDRPLPTDEVLRLAQKRMVGIGMATVYRTIKALTEQGWLIPVEVPGASPRYEVRGNAHHHHFHCLKCGKLFELEGCLKNLEKLIPSNFRVIDHVVLIHGFCETCDRSRGSSL
jgi:Fur family transcriptional regulator, ferric uptake regulator